MFVCSQVQHLPTDADVGSWLLFFQVGEENTHEHTHLMQPSNIFHAKLHSKLQQFYVALITGKHNSEFKRKLRSSMNKMGSTRDVYF